jgi:hypothetical protein
VPVPGAPNRLAITFTFDASQPCAVTTFVAATEEPARSCRLTPAKQDPAPPIFYEKGVSAPPAGVLLSRALICLPDSYPALPARWCEVPRRPRPDVSCIVLLYRLRSSGFSFLAPRRRGRSM